MKRSKLLDAVVDAKIESISQGGDCETYLREALRYGLVGYVDLTDEELLGVLQEHNLSKEDI
jgi:hypothetical protein